MLLYLPVPFFLLGAFLFGVLFGRRSMSRNVTRVLLAHAARYPRGSDAGTALRDLAKQVAHDWASLFRQTILDETKDTEQQLLSAAAQAESQAQELRRTACALASARAKVEGA